MEQQPQEILDLILAHVDDASALRVTSRTNYRRVFVPPDVIWRRLRDRIASASRPPDDSEILSILDRATKRKDWVMVYYVLKHHYQRLAPSPLFYEVALCNLTRTSERIVRIFHGFGAIDLPTYDIVTCFIQANNLPAGYRKNRAWNLALLAEITIRDRMGPWPRGRWTVDGTIERTGSHTGVPVTVLAGTLVRRQAAV
jgi:hypothetical protein